MKKVCLAACTAVLVTTAMAAQTRPDFSGTWTFEPQKSGTPGAKPTPPAAKTNPAATAGGQTGPRATLSFGAGTTVQLRLSQTASSLTIERVLGPSTQKFVHTFDGRENVNVNGRATLRTTSRWEGARLLTEGTEVVSIDSGDVTSTVKEARSINAAGELVVESSRTTEGRTTTSTRVYSKK
jgi:hypothetical protein